MSKTKSNNTPIGSVWLRAGQMFVGLFFIAASYYKLFDAFFFTKSAPLLESMNWWLSNKWPLAGMKQLMELTVRYEWMVTAAAAFVISFQMTGGALLFSNLWKRLAGWMLLIVQCFVLAGVFHGGLSFQTFVGLSLWLSVFYIQSDRMTRRKWRLMTYWLVLYGFLILVHRYSYGDPWPSAFPWQYKHYAEDVMSISVTLKEVVLAIGRHPLAPYWWASSWWIQLVLTGLMLTRYRIPAGIVWLVILLFHEWIWLNGLTSEGTLWVLAVFVWLAFEDASREKWGVIRMLPSWREVRSFFVSCRRWLNAK